jgi:hypothetical protein
METTSRRELTIGVARQNAFARSMSELMRIALAAGL